MPAPRDPKVRDWPMTCPVHGEILGRVHKVGKRSDGTQRYRCRCPECHTARNATKPPSPQPGTAAR